MVEESFDVTPFRPAALDVDPVSGNRIAAFSASSTALAIRYAALVDIAHAVVDPADIVAESPAAIPAATLRYLYPSRYCQADLVQQHAWDLFGQLPRGYAQVLAVRDWVRANVKFRIGASRSSTTVIETLRDGEGVCRDFAHTMIAYCRALNFPARFVTGVDYGADPTLGPPDFHAYVEVYLGGTWYLFDPTGISPSRVYPHRHRPRCGGRFVRHDLRSGAHRHAARRIQCRRRSCARVRDPDWYRASCFHRALTADAAVECHR